MTTALLKELLKKGCLSVCLISLLAACQTAWPEAAQDQKLPPAAARNGDQAAALLDQGRARMASGDAAGAESPLRRYVDMRPDDWRGVLALAAALDLTGRGGEADPLYERALGLAPHEPAVLNNRALSLALAGRLDESAALLRRAAAGANAPAKARGNLALVEQLRSEQAGKAPARKESKP